MVSSVSSHPVASRRLRMALLPLAAALATGCASVPAPSPDDPWESYNRSMFQFNEAMDKALLKPIARGYEAVTPQPARTCISNIFNNVGDVFSSLHSFLQGRGHDGINSMGRVLLNSTLGLGGCLDLASRKGVKRIPNDMGVTLGVWGFGSGPYVVLPFVGSSSLRDGVGWGISLAGELSTSGALVHLDNVPVRNSIIALYAIDLRANLLYADDMVDRIALDRYSFIRDAYLQRREAMVNGQFTSSSPGDVLPDYGDDEDDFPEAPASSAPSNP
ncbi:MlaA family lipoprotein [Mesopusillimonas faecipullorum]|nr:VacJ family lipoprotein [Mesopusillimonas faecipullorum]